MCVLINSIVNYFLCNSCRWTDFDRCLLFDHSEKYVPILSCSIKDLFQIVPIRNLLLFFSMLISFLSNSTNKKIKGLICIVYCSSSSVVFSLTVNTLFLPEIFKPIITHFLGILLTSHFFFFVNDVTVSSTIMWPPCFSIQHNFCYNRI